MMTDREYARGIRTRERSSDQRKLDAIARQFLRGVTEVCAPTVLGPHCVLVNEYTPEEPGWAWMESALLLRNGLDSPGLDDQVLQAIRSLCTWARETRPHVPHVFVVMRRSDPDHGLTSVATDEAAGVSVRADLVGHRLTLSFLCQAAE